MTLLPSQIETIRNINARAGKVSTIAIGLEMVKFLVDAGYITVKKDKCYPTELAAKFGGQSARQVAESQMHAHATIMGRWAAR